VAGEEGDSPRVAPQVQPRHVGLGSGELNVLQRDAENLGHDRGQDVVRPMADVDRAAEQGDATTAVQLELHLGVRHVVPVDGGAGTAQVGADGKAEAATAWHGAAALEESRTFDN